MNIYPTFHTVVLEFIIIWATKLAGMLSHRDNKMRNNTTRQQVPGRQSGILVWWLNHKTTGEATDQVKVKYT